MEADQLLRTSRPLLQIHRALERSGDARPPRRRRAPRTAGRRRAAPRPPRPARPLPGVRRSRPAAGRRRRGSRPTAAGPAPSRKSRAAGSRAGARSARAPSMTIRKPARTRRGATSAPQPGGRVADQRDRLRDRAGRDLPVGDGVGELLLGHPALRADRVAVHQRDDHVAAAVGERADLQREPDQRGPDARARASTWRRRAAEAAAAAASEQTTDGPANTAQSAPATRYRARGAASSARRRRRRPRGRPPRRRPRRSRRPTPAGRRRARPPRAQHRDQPGKDELEPADQRAGRPPRDGRCRSTSACTRGRAGGCTRRTRPRTRARRSSAACRHEIAQQRDVRGRPAEAEHAEAAPLASDGRERDATARRPIHRHGTALRRAGRQPARPAPPAADLPLAARMRPRTLEEFVGQRTCSASGPRCGPRSSPAEPHSMILYGPPGTGKTTLARMLAEYADAAFEELSAVKAGRAQVREVIDRARERRGGGRPHDLLPGRDPPLQQGPAGRAAARGRGRARHAHRRHDREPVLRGQLGAALARAGVRAAGATPEESRAAAARAGRGGR